MTDVSVIMSARNAAATIAQQLEALTHQTYSGVWELIVADNGSTDATAEIARGWAQSIPRIRVIDASERVGPNHARNKAAAVAQGSMLLFCDADDIAAPDWIDALVRGLSEFDMVRGHLDHETLQTSQRFMSQPDVGLRPEFHFLPFAPTGNCGVRAKVFFSVGGLKEDYSTCTGAEFSFRVQTADYRLGYARDAVMLVRHRRTLVSAARQSYKTALNFPKLYRDFRSAGMPRSTLKEVGVAWGKIILGFVPYMLLGPRRRRSWIRMVASRYGRIVGSVRNRVVYL